MSSVIIIIYCFGGVASWIMMSGWEFASLQRQFPRIAERDRKSDAIFAATLATGFAPFWPLTLLIDFFLNGGAEYGWKPVWRLK